MWTTSHVIMWTKSHVITWTSSHGLGQGPLFRRQGRLPSRARLGVRIFQLSNPVSIMVYITARRVPQWCDTFVMPLLEIAPVKHYVLLDW